MQHKFRIYIPVWLKKTLQGQVGHRLVIRSNISQFVIPPLQLHDRIEDWEPLFKASVTGLLTRTNGEKLAIGLLPGYVNRRPAELELVRDAIKLDSLNDAFALLKTLDDPVDQFESMQHLCRANWLRGEKIDDFYYRLKRKAKQADAKLELVCSILIAQLPKVIQGKVKTFYADSKANDGTITELNARLVIVEIKRLLNERGINLDVGCGNLDELSDQKKSSIAKVEHDDETHGENLPHVAANFKGNQPLGAFRSGRRSTGKKSVCYVCQKPGHLAFECYSQFCQRCGEKGHNLNDNGI